MRWHEQGRDPRSGRRGRGVTRSLSLCPERTSSGASCFAAARRFEKRFPDRVFDVGIAEQHAVTFAAGLACEGLVPFCTIYSTFLQRGYDQVVHDVSLQKLPGGWGDA